MPLAWRLAFRNLDAPLTRAQSDLYIDVQNAASMLFRLQLRGVDVGSPWTEPADKAEARIGWRSAPRAVTWRPSECLPPCAISPRGTA
jgi:hypothetical protein